MKTIVLVGCGKEKLARPAKAKDLYTGPLFRKARAWAERHGDLWRILSAKHKLLDPEEKIEPYDVQLPQNKKEFYWWKLVLRNSISCDLLDWKNTTPQDPRNPTWVCTPVRFVGLAGEPYLSFWDLEDNQTMRKFCTLEKPLEGLGIGERMAWLDRSLKKNSTISS